MVSSPKNRYGYAPKGTKQPICGNGLCESGETEVDCPADCAVQSPSSGFVYDQQHLAALYSFEEGSGPRALDFSLNQFHSSLYGPANRWQANRYGPTFVPGFVGYYALHFDGVDDYGDAGMALGISALQNDFTAGAWIKPEDLSVGRVQIIIGASRNPGINDGWGFGTVNDELVFIASRVGSPQTFGVDLKPGVWQHVLATVKDLDVNFYVNGNFVATRRLPSPVIPNTDSPTYIGAWTETTTPTKIQFFKGDIDDLFVLNKALTPEEVSSLFRDGTTIP